LTALRCTSTWKREAAGAPADTTAWRRVDDLPGQAHIHHMVNNSTAYAVVGRDLTVVRGGRRVLDGVDFTVPAGSVTGLLGPSGCGKSTLMRSVVGVQVVAGGTVDVLGLPAGSAALRSRVGYVTQAPSVYADLTVAENLRYFAALLRAPAGDVERVLADVGLADRAGSVVSRLSGGQRARVSLATALLGTPELLVLDEPTVGLDPVLRRDLWQLFHDLAARGTTLLVSSHVMDEAERCGRLLLMRDGVVLADDSPDALLRRTGTDDIERAFLAIVEQTGVPA
jgi:ABC-2 type transport system ATP-binding protein